MLTTADRIAETAEHFAAHNAHGYSQPNRGAGGSEYITLSDGQVYAISAADVDCSEMVRQCVNVGLERLAIAYMWTGNEDTELTKNGFRRNDYRHGCCVRGDILLRSGHTAVVVDGTHLAEAYCSETGGITGQTGDQTGYEVRIATIGSNWESYYRYEDNMTESDFKRIQQMLDKQTESLPKKVWGYVNKRLETVDAYQILRDIRDVVCGK